VPLASVVALFGRFPRDFHHGVVTPAGRKAWLVIRLPVVRLVRDGDQSFEARTLRLCSRACVLPQPEMEKAFIR